jgi:hypothetical protein
MEDVVSTNCPADSSWVGLFWAESRNDSEVGRFLVLGDCGLGDKNIVLRESKLLLVESK